MVSPTTDLPTPSQLPTADVVIFDGKCKFCQRQIARIHRADGAGRLAFVSLHDPLVAQRWPDLTHDQLMAEMHIVDQGGNYHAGAAAFQYLTRRLPRWWVMMPLLHLPGAMVVARWAYGWIAKRRYHWGREDVCDDGSCAVHF